MSRRFALAVLAVFSAAFLSLMFAGCRHPEGGEVGGVSLSVSVGEGSGEGSDVPRDGYLYFHAAVTAGGVDWSVSGGFDPGTRVTPLATQAPGLASARLEVARGEFASRLTVTARSRLDRAVSDSATVAVVSPQPWSVTGVSIVGGGVIVERGDSRLFEAEVSVTGRTPRDVTWDIVEAGIPGFGLAPGTRIDPSGLLVVDLLEPAGSLTVEARSVYDPAMYDSVTVTLVNPGETIEISVSVSPGSATAHRNDNVIFDATLNVYPPGLDPGDVRWTVSGNSSAATRMDPETGSASVLHIAGNESLGSLTVRAESTIDHTAYAVAMVTVIPRPAPPMWLVGNVNNWNNAGLALTPLPDGTAYWEGDKATGNHFRISLAPGTWYGGWFAPSVYTANVTVGTDLPMTRVDAGTENTWMMQQAGRFRIIVNAEAMTLRVEPR